MRGLRLQRNGEQAETAPQPHPTRIRDAVTALDRYAKLEAIGQYFDAHEDSPREVVISFGERSLIIMSLDDHPLAHWPLASLRANANPAQLPIKIAPDGVNDERLLLDDPEMSTAIAEVCPDLYRSRSRSARRLPLRAIAGAMVLAGLSVFAFLAWPLLPGSLADLMTPKREAALGTALAARMPHMIEPAAPPALCIGEDGTAALHALAKRLQSASGSSLPLIFSVLDHPAADALLLPGGHVILFRGLLGAARTPEELAAILAHAAGHAERRDPINLVLDEAGLITTARMLFGNVTGSTVTGEAARILLDTPFAPGTEADADMVGFDALAAAGLSTMAKARFAERLSRQEPPSPYSKRHPWTLQRAKAAASADTVGDAPFTPALRDRDWITLGNICDRTKPAEPASF